MKRSAFLCSLLLAAACGGGKKADTTTSGGKGDVAGGGGNDVVGDSVASSDPTYAARKAFANPGGMWMPRQMAHPVHDKALRAMGVTIPADKLSNPLNEPLNAVVALGGCTGSFVSPDGLVVTNHHCVQGALQFNATPDNNVVENGFLAKTRAEELPAGPTQKVSVAQAITDVTKEMTDGLDAIKDPIARKRELEKRQKALVAGCEKDRPGLRCDVASFFRGAEWNLIEYLEIRDVRLVYVPARSVGNYGGEIDNWAWPRHTGDFSFFRAYVGKDGKPADPSPDNVPFKPKHHLTIDQDGIKQDDFVMIAGYPGKTNRISTYAEVEFDVNTFYPYLIQYLQERYDVLENVVKDPQTGASTRIKAGVAKQGVQNGLEKYQGVLAGLKKGDMMARKKATDEQVRAWAAKPGNEDTLAAITALDKLNETENSTALAEFDRGNALQGSALLRNAVLFVRLADERTKKDGDRKPGYQLRDLPRQKASQKQFLRGYDATLDRTFFRMSLLRAAAMPEADRPWLATIVGAKKGAKIDAAMIDAALDRLYKGTKLEDEALRLQLLEKATPATLKASKDPFIKLAVALWPTLKKIEDTDDSRYGESLTLSPKYASAMNAALEGFVAPDANLTLRVTYGTIKPFKAGEKPFTTASEILAKDKGEEPFDAPKKLIDAVKAKNWGPYADSVLGEVPVDFLGDLDITGGNSGSAVLDADGQLIGLAFDGTTEGLASDVVFDQPTTRTIMVDFRYAMWVMDLIDGADNVLEEMGVKPSL